MKFKFASLLLLLVFSGTLNAQVSLLTPVIQKSSESFTQTETGSVTQFKLKATEKQMAELKSNAASISKSATIEWSSLPNNEYQVKLTVSVQNHPEYVHKMFIHLGFEYFLFDGKKRSVSELPSVLKSLIK